MPRNSKKNDGFPPEGSVLVVQQDRYSPDYWEGGVFLTIEDALNWIREEYGDDRLNEFRLYALNIHEGFRIEEYEELIPIKKWRVVDKSQPAGLI